MTLETMRWILATLCYKNNKLNIKLNEFCNILHAVFGLMAFNMNFFPFPSNTSSEMLLVFPLLESVHDSHKPAELYINLISSSCLLAELEQ